MTVTLKVSIDPTSVSFQVENDCGCMDQNTHFFQGYSPKETYPLNILNLKNELFLWKKLNEYLRKKTPLQLIPLYELPSRNLLQLIEKHFNQSIMKSKIKVIKICFAQPTTNFIKECILPSREINTLPEIIIALKTIQDRAYSKNINFEVFRALGTPQQSQGTVNACKVDLQPAIQALLTEKEAKQLSPEERCNLQSPQIATLVEQGMLSTEAAKAVNPLYRERLEKNFTQNDLSESNPSHIANTILGPPYASLIPLIETRKLSLNEAITCPPEETIFLYETINHLTALLNEDIISFPFFREILQAYHENPLSRCYTYVDRLNDPQILDKVLNRKLSFYLCDLPWLQPALNNGDIALDWAKKLTPDDRSFLRKFQHSIEKEHASSENILSILKSNPNSSDRERIEKMLILLKEEYPSGFDEAIIPYDKKRTFDSLGIGLFPKESDLYINHRKTFDLMKRHKHTSIIYLEAVNYFKQKKITFCELVKIFLTYINICTPSNIPELVNELRKDNTPPSKPGKKFPIPSNTDTHSNTSTANGSTQTNKQNSPFPFFSTSQETNYPDDATRRGANKGL